MNVIVDKKEEQKLMLKPSDNVEKASTKLGHKHNMLRCKTFYIVFLSTSYVICSLLVTVTNSINLRPWRRRPACQNERRTAFSATGCPCLLNNEPCFDPYTTCVNNICKKCPFRIQTSVPSVTLACTLSSVDDIGMSVQVTCGRLPLKSCSLSVYYANGTDPNNSIGGAGDTILAGAIGYICPGPDPTITDCDPATQITNLEFDHVLTTKFVNVSLSDNQIFFAPPLLELGPPQEFFPFSLTTGGPGEVINQYYSLQCVDALGQISNVANFQIVFQNC